MPREENSKVKKALVTERTATGNDNLEQVTADLFASYKPHKNPLAVYTVAIKPLEKPIFGFRRDTKEPRLLYRAGWSISAQDAAFIEQLMSDPEIKELNEKMWAAMEKQGMKVKVAPPALQDVKVLQPEGSEAAER